MVFALTGWFDFDFGALLLIQLSKARILQKCVPIRRIKLKDWKDFKKHFCSNISLSQALTHAHAYPSRSRWLKFKPIVLRNAKLFLLKLALKSIQHLTAPRAIVDVVVVVGSNLEANSFFLPFYRRPATARRTELPVDTSSVGQH